MAEDPKAIAVFDKKILRKIQPSQDARTKKKRGVFV